MVDSEKEKNDIQIYKDGKWIGICELSSRMDRVESGISEVKECLSLCSKAIRELSYNDHQAICHKSEYITKFHEKVAEISVDGEKM